MNCLQERQLAGPGHVEPLIMNFSLHIHPLAGGYLGIYM
jgi:hypothetical protein